MKNKNFGRKRQAIYILSNRKSTRIIKTLMDFFFFIKVKIKMVCFSVPSEQTSGIAIATMILGIIAVVCMVSCCCTPIAIITGIAAVICFAVTPKVRGTRGNKAKAGLICGIIGIIGSVILITVFVVNILLSSDFQNEMKEFNTHYDTYIDENDDSI